MKKSRITDQGACLPSSSYLLRSGKSHALIVDLIHVPEPVVVEVIPVETLSAVPHLDISDTALSSKVIRTSDGAMLTCLRTSKLSPGM